jgi:hypothetical protein
MAFLKSSRAVPICATLLFVTACSQNNAVPPSAAVPPSVQTVSANAVAPDDNTSVLKKLNKDVVIGSTVDPNNGDMGPRALSIVTSTYGGLKKNDLLVCNFENASGTPGDGTTIELLDSQPSSSPSTFVQSSDIEGCDGSAVTHGDQVYGAGMTSGLLASFNENGKLQQTFSSPLVEPFSDADAYRNKAYAPENVFISDASTGSIVKIGVNAYASSNPLQVATGFAVGTQSGWGTLGPSGLQYNSKIDALYIVDGVNNTVVSFSHASALLVKNEIVVESNGKFKCLHKQTTCGKQVYRGSPLDAPVAAAILPNGNLIVANGAGGNTLVELTPKGKILDTKTVDSSSSQGIYGLVASGTNDNNTVLFFSDTNDNNVQELEQ